MARDGCPGPSACRAGKCFVISSCPCIFVGMVACVHHFLLILHLAHNELQRVCLRGEKVFSGSLSGIFVKTYAHENFCYALDSSPAFRALKWW